MTVETYPRLDIVSMSEEYVAGQRVTVYRTRMKSDKLASLTFNAITIPLGDGGT